MRAITFQGPDKDLELQDIEIPQPGKGQLLLKVAACGICGSDVHAYQVSMSAIGTVFGHEFSGEVAKIGEGVDGDWNIGDRAISLGAMACGACEACEAENSSECSNIQLIGFSVNGAYSEYVLVRAVNSIKIPDSIAFSRAALVEPLTVGLAAYRDGEVPLCGDVLIIGAGIIGITVAKWARFFGAGHIGIADLEPARLERAAKSGATLTINARDNPDPVEAFRQATGKEPSVILECTGRPILQQIIDTAPQEAHLVVVGAGMEPETIISVAATQKKLRMTFSFGYTLEDFEFIIRMIDQGRMTTDGLISETVTLEQVPAAFAGLLKPNAHCKVMIEP